MKRNLRFLFCFLLIPIALCSGACSYLRWTNAIPLDIIATSNPDGTVQPTSTSMPSSTFTKSPSATPSRTSTPKVSLLSELPIGDYVVVSKRLDGCDRIGVGCTGLFVISQEGDEIGLLYSGDDAIFWASLSPNGHEIAVLDPPGYMGNSYSRLVVADFLMLDEKIVATVQRGIGPVVWSSDGVSLLVTIEGNIELINVESSERRVILDCSSIWEEIPATDCEPLAWSPDGNWIAIDILFERSGSQDSRQGTYLIPASCTTSSDTCHTQVHKISEVIALGTSWSPNGDMIAIGDYLGTIYLYDVESESISSLPVTNFAIRTLSWSPDGRILAYAGRSILGLITISTGQVDELVLRNVGEYVSAPFWLHQESASE